MVVFSQLPVSSVVSELCEKAMTVQPDNVSKLKQPQVTIRSDKDAMALQSRQTKYPAKVEGITGLRLIVGSNGSKNWEAVFKVNGKAKTFNYGTFPGISISEAIRRASHDYALIKQGNDPKRQKRLVKQQNLATNRAEKPIVALAEERTAHLFDAGKLSEKSAELDRLYIKKLNDLIGQKAFSDFTYKDAAALYKKTKAKQSDCEKLHKLLQKTFNFLDGKTKEVIPLDISSELIKAWPLPSIKKNSDKFIRQADLGLFWSRLMHSDESTIHKDAALMALLTGERKTAVLNMRVSNIHLTAPIPYLYVEGKTSQGQPTKNVVPITPILGAFIARLIGETQSDYLFPSQRKGNSPNLTNISKKLFDDIGDASGHRQSPHTLRRTTAQLAATCIGSQQLADEHILHFGKWTSGAKANYLDPQSQEFLAARLPTYDKFHKHLDDVITSQGIPRGQQPPDSVWREEPIAFIAEAITFPEELDSYNEWTDERPASPICAQVVANEHGISISSPLCSYLAGEIITVALVEKSRPHTWKAINSTGMLSANSPQLRALLTGIDQEPEIPNFKAMIE